MLSLEEGEQVIGDWTYICVYFVHVFQVCLWPMKHDVLVIVLSLTDSGRFQGQVLS